MNNSEAVVINEDEQAALQPVFTWTDGNGVARHLFLGDFSSTRAFCRKFLSSHDASAKFYIVTCSGDLLSCQDERLDLPEPSGRDVDLCKELTSRLVCDIFPSVARRIAHNLVLKRRSVVVHCSRGRNRSVSVVLAFLMMFHRWTLERASRHLLVAGYPVGIPSAGQRSAPYMDALTLFEQRLQCVTSILPVGRDRMIWLDVIGADVVHARVLRHLPELFIPIKSLESLVWPRLVTYEFPSAGCLCDDCSFVDWGVRRFLQFVCTTIDRLLLNLSKVGESYGPVSFNGWKCVIADTHAIECLNEYLRVACAYKWLVLPAVFDMRFTDVGYQVFEKEFTDGSLDLEVLTCSLSHCGLHVVRARLRKVPGLYWKLTRSLKIRDVLYCTDGSVGVVSDDGDLRTKEHLEMHKLPSKAVASTLTQIFVRRPGIGFPAFETAETLVVFLAEGVSDDRLAEEVFKSLSGFRHYLDGAAKCVVWLGCVLAEEAATRIQESVASLLPLCCELQMCNSVHPSFLIT
jgi:hypothetical protein